jgi:hypothetical protein
MAEAAKRPNRGHSLMTSIEGTLAILGIKTIRILIVGLAEGITATPNVQTVATDVPTAGADVLTAGTDATTAAIITAPVRTTEILEVILEVIAGRTVTEITEAAEARGHIPERRGHLGPLVGAPAPTPRLQETTGGQNLAQRPTNRGESTKCSKSYILRWREAATVPPTMTPWGKSAAQSAPMVERYTMNLTARNMLNTAKSVATTATFTTTERRIATRLLDSHKPF